MLISARQQSDSVLHIRTFFFVISHYDLSRDTEYSSLGYTVSSQLFQLCWILCDPVDSSPPESSARGILQARIPEWVAIPSSRGSSRPRDRTRVSCIMQVGSLPPAPPGKPRQPGDTGVFQPEMQPLPGGILARLA